MEPWPWQKTTQRFVVPDDASVSMDLLLFFALYAGFFILGCVLLHLVFQKLVDLVARRCNVARSRIMGLCCQINLLTLLFKCWTTSDVVRYEKLCDDGHDLYCGFLGL
jgi:hypothetical protein